MGEQVLNEEQRVEKMKDEIKKLRSELCNVDSFSNDAFYDLKKAKRALSELRQYDWDCRPDPSKAIEYMNSIGREQKSLGEDAERSFKYIFDYERIMWLVEVALDYCNSALNEIRNII